jgi:TRAP-type C4-dicarboxylate transport system permease small subunit
MALYASRSGENRKEVDFLVVKVLKKISEGLHGIGAVILTAIFLLVVLDVITRTAHVSFIKDVGELAGLGVVMLTYLAVPLCMRLERQIRVDLVITHLSMARQRIIRVVTDVIMIGFSCFMCWMGVKMVATTFARGFASGTWHIPMGIIQIALPLGLLFLAIEVIFEVVSLVKAGKPQVLEGQ